MPCKTELIKLIYKLCHSSGTSGNESDAAKNAAEELSKYMSVKTDNLGNVIGHLDGDSQRFYLDAHIDQIGLIVTSITDEGFLKVASCGGTDSRVFDASDVTVWGKKPIRGVLTSTPPHLSSGKEDKAADISDVAVDVGMSKIECEKVVSQGDRITFNFSSDAMCGNYVTSGALDDRVGVAALIYAVSLLKDNKLQPDLTVVFSAQEETGGSGAKTSSFANSSDEAIAVDVSFGSCPDVKNTEGGLLGKGPMIGFSPSLNYEMSKKLQSIAENNNIPFQKEIMSGKTGTNADDISVSGVGTKMALISIPLRNMHTAVEVINVDDVINTGELILKYISERMQNNV